MVVCKGDLHPQCVELLGLLREAEEKDQTVAFQWNSVTHLQVNATNVCQWFWPAIADLPRLFRFCLYTEQAKSSLLWFSLMTFRPFFHIQVQALTVTLAQPLFVTSVWLETHIKPHHLFLPPCVVSRPCYKIYSCFYFSTCCHMPFRAF